MKVFAALEIILLLLTTCFSVYRTSKDSIDNIRNDYVCSSYGYNDITLLNWNGADGAYTSGEDAQILLNNADRYIHNIKIAGDISFPKEKYRFFIMTLPELNLPRKKASGSHIISATDAFI